MKILLLLIALALAGCAELPSNEATPQDDERRPSFNGQDW